MNKKRFSVTTLGSHPLSGNKETKFVLKVL